MSAPAPRSSSEGQVVSIVVEGLRRLEDSVAQGFRDVNATLSRLPEQYVARREFDRYRDEQTLDLQQAQRKHDNDVAELRAAHDKAEAKRVSAHRFLWGTAIAALASLAAVAAVIVSLLQR
jgi:hypothetical protein